MFELIQDDSTSPRIAVFGVGGCGCNTINQLCQANLSANVQLIAVNTDSQSLALSQCGIRLQIGEQTTKGLGAGAIPQKGYEAAKESEAQLKELIAQADIIFITGGMGGGTGTGALPLMANITSELNKPTVSVVTTPFAFEGNKRNHYANQGLEQLMQHNNAVIVLPNDKLAKALDKKISLISAFNESNQILEDVLVSLTTTISQAGLINIDLNDFIEVISHQGQAAMGVAKQQTGQDIELTINEALKNPLLAEMDISRAQGAIVSVMATEAIELSQYHQIGECLQQQLAPNALVIIGLTIVPELDNELELMVITTGMSQAAQEEIKLSNPAKAIKHYEAEKTDSGTSKTTNENSNLLNIHDFLQQNAQQTNLTKPQAHSINQFEQDLETPTYHRRRC
ncbi:cell division protein FtsZ [Shewanella maritima]|uniref:cell division protein FtsZ n=1 Tax=Shewanella maritima TaxID=2520507 RepID=UPI003735F320